MQWVYRWRTCRQAITGAVVLKYVEVKRRERKEMRSEDVREKKRESRGCGEIELPGST